MVENSPVGERLPLNILHGAVFTALLPTLILFVAFPPVFVGHVGCHHIVHVPTPFGILGLIPVVICCAKKLGKVSEYCAAASRAFHPAPGVVLDRYRRSGRRPHWNRSGLIGAAGCLPPEGRAPAAVR